MNCNIIILILSEKWIFWNTTFVYEIYFAFFFAAGLFFRIWNSFLIHTSTLHNHDVPLFNKSEPLYVKQNSLQFMQVFHMSLLSINHMLRY